MQTHPDQTRELEALLEFQLESGIDCCLGEAPLDWVARSQELAAEQQQARMARSQMGASQRAQSQGPQSQMGAPLAGAASSSALQSGPVPAPPFGNQPPASRPAAGSPPVPAQPQPASSAATAVPSAEGVQAARDLAASARSLEELKDLLLGFTGCNLRQTAKNLVFADGNPGSRVMFVGEAPGKHEDQQGKPFVGRSGQLLDRMLAAIGLDRTTAYIANVVPWRPPGDRTPTPQETELCKPFITRQIELAAPEVLVFLGAASAKSLMGTTEGIRRLRGRWMTYPSGGRDFAALATYHPAYLLRSPLEKRLSWRDFQSIRQKLSKPE